MIKNRLSEENIISIVGAILLTWTTIPITIAEISPNVDMSGMYLLNIAGEKGLKFGTDLMFTYGPLGFLYMTHNIGDNVAIAAITFLLLGLLELCLVKTLYQVLLHCLA